MCLQKTVNEDAKTEFLHAFGEHIKNLRLEKGLSQYDLAVRCKTNTRKIGRTERGEYDFKFSLLMVLAIGLDMNVAELLNFNFSERIYSEFFVVEKKTSIRQA